MKSLIVCGTLMCAGVSVFLCAQNDPRDLDKKPFIRSVDGAVMYQSYCAVCHGTDGRGGGPMAAALKVLPTDLTHISARNHDVFPAARIEKIISGNEEIRAGHGTREMPVWGPVLSQIEWDRDLSPVRLHNLVKYIENMQAK